MLVPTTAPQHRGLLRISRRFTIAHLELDGGCMFWRRLNSPTSNNEGLVLSSDVGALAPLCEIQAPDPGESTILGPA